MKKPSIFHRFTSCLACALIVAPGVSCGDSSDEIIRVDVPFSGHEFPNVVCSTSLGGSANATDSVRGATGIAGYEYLIGGDDGGFVVELSDEAGESLGQLRMTIDLTMASLGSWTIQTTYEQDQQVLASQTQNFRISSGTSVWLETVQEAEGLRAVHWSTLDADLDVTSLTLGAPVTGTATTGPDVRRTPSGVYRTLVIQDEDGLTSDAEVRTFLADTGLDAFSESESFQRLVLGAGDLGWLNDAEVQLRRCRASGRAEAENVLRQGLTGTTKKALECSPGPFERFAAVDSVLGAIGTGVAVTGALVAGGVVVSGAAIGATLVVASVGAYVAGNAIQNAVNNNRRGVVGGLSRVGNAIASGGSNTGENDAVVGFFAGGGKSSGDPHLDTLDGRAYDLQTAGEFIFVESVVDDFEIQVRQEPLSAGACGNVTFNTSVATRVDGHAITVERSTLAPVRIDGEPLSFIGGEARFSDGSAIQERDNSYIFSWPTGDAMMVRTVSALDVRVRLSETRRGAVRGLLGDFDGDRSDDFALRDGTPLEAPLPWDTLVGAYSDSWRVTPAESLFFYPSGLGPQDFVIEGFPSAPQDISDLTEAQRTSGEATCRAAGIEAPRPLEDCILDVVCTADDSFTDAHTDRSPDDELRVQLPIFLTDWQQQGDPNAGNWEVTPDGRSVLQTNNGQPTFFVSPEDLFNVEIRGTFESAGSDDDLMGFVFGMQKPIAANGDQENDYRMYILSWKGGRQFSGGSVAQEGLALGYIDGVVEDVIPTFWGQEPSALYRPLGTYFGEGRGWERETQYRFSLRYGADGIVVEIDDQVIFDVPARDLTTPLVPGRFGFYNYSQPRVTYANFSAVSLSADPSCGNDVLDPGETCDPTVDPCCSTTCDGFRTRGRCAEPAESCRAHFDSGSSNGDGIYRVDLEGDDNVRDVFCDMTRDDGGWMLVYQKSGGTTGDSFDEWMGPPINEDSVPSSPRSRSTEVYKNAVPNSALWDLFTEARVEVSNDDAPQKNIIFGTVGTSSTTWFSTARVERSSWSLPATGDNLSIEGTGPRRWFVYGTLDRCDNSQFYMMVSHQAVCPTWEGVDDLPSEIRYSTNAGVSAGTTMGTFVTADTLTVWVR